MLGNVNTGHQTYSTLQAYQSYSVEASTFSAKKTNGEESVSMDKVSLRGESSTTITYTGSMTLDGETGARFQMLQTLVSNLLTKQGVDTNIMTDGGQVDLTAITPGDAEQLVSEDGYFGVEQTSERIFQFAIGIAGGDPSRLDAIKQGVEQGFQEAIDAFGGWLPDISYDTIDAVMEKLDNWAQGA